MGEVAAVARKIRPTNGRIAAFLAAVVVWNTAALYLVFTSRGQFVIWDIQPVRTAARAVLQGEDPYSLQVTRAIQLEAYGRLPREGEDVHAFAYPLYVAYLALPLAVLPNAWAQALWLTLLEVAAVVGVAACAQIWGWPRGRALRGVLILSCLTFYPVVWSFVLGQLALPAFALLAIATRAAIQRKDRQAGVTLALAAIKPQVVLLVLPAWALWGIIGRRWSILAALAVTLAALILPPTVIQPSWIGSFVARVGEYAEYSPFTAPTAVLAASCCPGEAAWLGPALVVAISLPVVFGWWKAATTPTAHDFLWATGATLIATMAFGPEVALVNQVVLLIPIFGLLRGALADRGATRWAGIGLAVLWGAGPWILSWVPPVATAPAPRFAVEHRVISPLVPLTLAVAWAAFRSRLVPSESAGP